MKKIIWGTAQRAGRLFSCLEASEIYAFMDSDPMRTGTCYGKPILHPQEIEDWENFFFYVPYNYYSEISFILKKHGLKEGVDYVKYWDWYVVNYEKSRISLERGIEEIRRVSSDWKGKPVLFTCTTSSTAPHFKLIDIMKENGISIKVISIGYGMDAQKIHQTYRSTRDALLAPIAWDFQIMPRQAVLSEHERSKIENKSYLREAAENAQTAFPSAEWSDCCYQICLMEKYIHAFLDNIKPSYVFLFGSSMTSHYIFYHMCKEKNIPVIFTHEGVLPGTYAFQIKGEVGRSVPAVNYKKFKRLNVTSKEISQANNVLEFLYNTNANRRKQKRNNCKEIIENRITKGKPIIFFAGQNDIQSHMVPYTEDTRRYNSPIFRSTLEAVLFLSRLCKKNGWNLVYKPHPMCLYQEPLEFFPDNVICICSGNVNDFIDCADVTITILSATSYNALIRNKPVVMLGYNQLRGKGCTYEAFNKIKIEDTIKEALKYGFSQEQKNAFQKHIAQCLKYYLYDDLQERPLRFGKDIPRSMDEFYELERLLEIGETEGLYCDLCKIK